MSFPTVQPARRVHVPSLPSGVPNVGGATSQEKAHRLTAAVRDGYVGHRRSIPEGVDPQELKDRAGDFAHTDAALALDPALAAVKADTEAATADIQDRIRGLGVDPTDQAAQLAAQRYWTRTLATLGAALKRGPGQAVAAAQQALAAATPAQVDCLAEELPEWIEQNQLPAGWLPAALGKAAGLSDAVDAARVKQRQHDVIAQNIASLKRSMAKDVDPQPLLDPFSVDSTPYSDEYSGPGLQH